MLTKSRFNARMRAIQALPVVVATRLPQRRARFWAGVLLLLTALMFVATALAWAVGGWRHAAGTYGLFFLAMAVALAVQIAGETPDGS